MPSEKKSSINPIPLLIVGVFFVGLAVAIYKFVNPPEPNTVKKKPKEEDDVTLKKPAPRDSDYVGSQACAECHAELFQRYQGHPMAQSMAVLPEDSPLEGELPTEGELLQVHPPVSDKDTKAKAGRRYYVSKTNEGTFHHEKFLDDEGKALYEHAEKVHFAIGSGSHGRSYLLNRNGKLFQSPISWYSSKESPDAKGDSDAKGDPIASHWDLSPGYEADDAEQFNRSIGDSCLYCHSGRVNPDRPNTDTYHPDKVFVEAAIGCERCHGPGGKHVKKQTESPTSLGNDPWIVNPTRLSSLQRESVCVQCHLQGRFTIPRYGRSHFDFRPGDAIDDTLVVFVDDETPGSRTRAVSHVEQMWDSECFKNSAGKMGCISCHDPHGIPTPEKRVSFYRDRCLKCHSDQEATDKSSPTDEKSAGCSLPEAEQQAAPANGSCVHCHMPNRPLLDVPHSAATDHRILRRPDEATIPEQRPPDVNQLKIFASADRRLPQRSLDRMRGIVMSKFVRETEDKRLAEKAQKFLLPRNLAGGGDLNLTVRALGDDVDILSELATTFFVIDQKEKKDLSIPFWIQILKTQPNHEEALGGLAVVSRQHSRFDDAEKYYNRLLKANPYSLTALRQFSDMLVDLGRFDEAIKLTERIIAIEPVDAFAHALLIDAYQSLKQPDKSKKHERILEYIEREQGN